MTWAIDLPDPLGSDLPWITITYVDSEAEAIGFAQEFYGADDKGRIKLVSFVAEEEIEHFCKMCKRPEGERHDPDCPWARADSSSPEVDYITREQTYTKGRA